MTKFLVLMLASSFVLALCSVSVAGYIVLPEEVGAKASIKSSDRYGYVEKSLIVELDGKRRAISTKDGILDLRAVVNHGAQPKLWEKVCEEMKTEEKVGGKIYLAKMEKSLAESLGIDISEITLTGTAVDMDNAAISIQSFGPLVVAVLTTGGAKSNALRAGTDEGKLVADTKPGTINIIVLSNVRMTDGALANSIITVTEAKAAALQDLNVPSSFTSGAQATGTGTDTVIVVSGTDGPKVEYTGGHSKIGELIAKGVYESVVEAIGKQDGTVLQKAEQ
jgi:adenosylcobinamide amidohydrolase